MRLADLAKQGDDRLLRLRALGRTNRVRRKADASRETIRQWLAQCSRPIVSCGGGKDSTLTLQLVREVDPNVPAWRADPPNPLSDRDDHVRRLEQCAGGDWHVVRYDWPVDDVLRGRAQYPVGHKIRRLMATQWLAGIDGVAMGIRASESRKRRMAVGRHGDIHQRSDGLIVCWPVANWTADEVIGYLLATDVMPLNPVYRRTHLLPWGDLEELRDGTWWPHGDAVERRPWMRWHYGEHIDEFDAAVRIRAASECDFGGGNTQPAEPAPE